MLSYQHSYHAGNFADVIKHVTLTHIIHYLTKKDKPLLYLETHAGRGQYTFTHPMAKKTNEYKSGIFPIWQQRVNLPAAFKPYLDIIQSINPLNQLINYPGSPVIAKYLLRKQDRLYLCERHPQEFSALKLQLAKKSRLHVTNQDGWEALNALLPPPENRALIFMDPSFEIKDEYQSIPKLIRTAYTCFPLGTYCLWYPITASQHYLTLTKKLKNLSFPNTLNIQFFLNKPSKVSEMYGAGLWIINPPYTLGETIQPVLDTCKKLLNPPHSYFVIE